MICFLINLNGICYDLHVCYLLKDFVLLTVVQAVRPGRLWAHFLSLPETAEQWRGGHRGLHQVQGQQRAVGHRRAQGPELYHPVVQAQDDQPGGHISHSDHGQQGRSSKGHVGTGNRGLGLFSAKHDFTRRKGGRKNSCCTSPPWNESLEAGSA